VIDFYDELDEKIAKLRRTQGVNPDEERLLNKRFFEEKVNELRLKLRIEDFVAQLAHRNIKAKNKSRNNCLGVKLFYKNGFAIELDFCIDNESGRLNVKTRHSEEEKRYFDKGSYGRAEWKDDILDRELKLLIAEYVHLMEQHGGI
jgi:hypothetical protein